MLLFGGERIGVVMDRCKACQDEYDRWFNSDGSLRADQPHRLTGYEEPNWCRDCETLRRKAKEDMSYPELS